MNDNVFSVGACPAKYQDKLFLAPTDIMEILGISENSCYRYLQREDLPYSITKIGKLIRINAMSFWSWYRGQAGVGGSNSPALVVRLVNYHKNYRNTDGNFLLWGIMRLNAVAR